MKLIQNNNNLITLHWNDKNCIFSFRRGLEKLKMYFSQLIDIIIEVVLELILVFSKLTKIS